MLSYCLHIFFALTPFLNKKAEYVFFHFSWKDALSERARAVIAVLEDARYQYFSNSNFIILSLYDKLVHYSLHVELHWPLWQRDIAQSAEIKEGRSVTFHLEAQHDGIN